MKLHHVAVAVIVFMLFGSGCASDPMLATPSQEVDTPAPREAQIVFMRYSFVGSAINASLYDVSEEGTEFLGILSNAKKIAYKTTPGKHTFMVVSEAADFMEANLLPGKTYYSIVTPRMGAWKARFSLWPIRNDADSRYNVYSEEFKKWQDETILMTNTKEAHNWYESNKGSVQTKKLKYWPVWEKKSPAALSERTLNPEDGI